jgi:Tat protein secretion system quality control protein TatD with DNase activity
MKRSTKKRMKRVMFYAQLDLAAAVRYALTEHDSFEVKAAVKTIKELSEFTGKPVGDDLYYLIGD